LKSFSLHGLQAEPIQRSLGEDDLIESNRLEQRLRRVRRHVVYHADLRVAVAGDGFE